LRDSARSLFLCEVAIATARQLQDKTILGRVLYKKGRTQFEQDNINLAIETYSQSKAALEEAGARRDLIYVLSELGTLHIYAADPLKAKQNSKKTPGPGELIKNNNDGPAALPDEYGTAFAWSNLGQVAEWRGDYEVAVEAFKKALAFWKRVPEGVVSY